MPGFLKLNSLRRWLLIQLTHPVEFSINSARSQWRERADNEVLEFRFGSGGLFSFTAKVPGRFAMSCSRSSIFEAITASSIGLVLIFCSLFVDIAPKAAH